MLYARNIPVHGEEYANEYMKDHIYLNREERSGFRSRAA